MDRMRPPPPVVDVCMRCRGVGEPACCGPTFRALSQSVVLDSAGYAWSATPVAVAAGEVYRGLPVPASTPPPAAAAVRSWLVAAGESQAALARSVGVSPVTLWRWLAGRRQPSLAAAARVEAATGVRASAWVAH